MFLPDFRVRQRDYLLEISRALTQELDLEKLLGRILNIAIEMLTGQAGLIALHDHRGNWRVAVSYGLPPVFLRYLGPYLDQISVDLNPDEFELLEVNHRLGELARLASMGLLNGVGLPLVARQSIVGTIFIFRSYQENFTNNDRTVLSSFADQAAIAVRMPFYTATLCAAKAGWMHFSTQPPMASSSFYPI